MRMIALLIVAGAVAAGAAQGVRAADTPVRHIRGTIASVERDRLTVATATGRVVVTLAKNARIAGVEPATSADITPGTFVGTANVPGPGGARALEVVVFPKALAGTGEGDYAWDLPAGGNATSAMPSGTVARPRTSAMTNGTVRSVAGSAVQTMTLTYKGGTKTVSIPPGAPIVRIVPASRALLVAGAHVFAAPPASAAPVVIVGEKGAIPPM